jgi:hypothetical protein
VNGVRARTLWGCTAHTLHLDALPLTAGEPCHVNNLWRSLPRHVDQKSKTVSVMSVMVGDTPVSLSLRLAS